MYVKFQLWVMMGYIISDLKNARKFDMWVPIQGINTIFEYCHARVKAALLSFKTL